MLEMKIRSSSPANRPVRRILCACTKIKKIKKWLFTAGCLQRLEKADCQWLLSKKEEKKKEGKKSCVNQINVLTDYMRFLQDYNVSH